MAAAEAKPSQTLDYAEYGSCASTMIVVSTILDKKGGRQYMLQTSLMVREAVEAATIVVKKSKVVYATMFSIKLFFDEEARLTTCNVIFSHDETDHGKVKHIGVVIKNMDELKSEMEKVMTEFLA